MSLSRDIAASYVTLSKQGYSAEDIATSIADFLNENNLFSLKDKVLSQIKAYEEAEKYYQTAHISTAHHLSEAIQKKIAHAVSNSEGTHVSVTENKELIAGYIARYRGIEWDASLKGSLERLRADLKN